MDEEELRGIPKPGDVLAGRYEIESVIGAGGMGVVLAARHTALGQRVAVKFLLPELAKRQPEAAERFLREARAAIHLKSEHIARVMDVGTEPNGAAYMVMEFLEGRDLQRVSREQAPLAISWVVDCVLQAAGALAEAHAAGIVHRDLKPANLFVTTHADGSPLVKVLDFGISKAPASGERGITRTDAVMGSPGYMSPEQIRSAKHVDQRADIWGLGVVLYELLSGKPPFDGDNIATLSAQIVLETPAPVDAVRPEVPHGLAEVVGRCLEKDPGARYQNVAELARALAPFGSGTNTALVDRIARIGAPVSAYAQTVNASSADIAVAGTQGTWERGAARGKSRVPLIVGPGGAAVAVVVIAFLAGRGSSTDKSAAEAEKPAPSATTVEAAPTDARASAAPVAQGVEPPASAAPPAPSHTASAEPESSVAGRPARRPAAPVRPRCGPGEALSKGHCCPTGLVWLNGRCDRPLATLP